MAADSGDCRAIAFCGVHFMAETADVLARDEVDVYLPDLAAGCSMVIMPSPRAPLSTIAFIRLVQDLDLPPGTADIQQFVFALSGRALYVLVVVTPQVIAHQDARRLLAHLTPRRRTAGSFAFGRPWEATTG